MGEMVGMDVRETKWEEAGEKGRTTRVLARLGGGRGSIDGGSSRSPSYGWRMGWSSGNGRQDTEGEEEEGKTGGIGDSSESRVCQNEGCRRVGG